ncbi:MAG: hypothetical protein DMF62_02960 [Acidobacteria bacterium]|nr:MAG: hypothetical protein DMF62_02960 [Acidobacteriota bacterium]
MKIRTYRPFSVRFAAIFLFTTVALMPAAGRSDDENPSAEEILRRHAESIGTERALADTANRVAVGVSEFVLNLPAARSAGKMLFASDRNNTMLISSFDLLEYPYEKIGFFRGKVDVPFIMPGMRSPMGSYLLLNDNLLSERLFGGAVSCRWRMLDPAAIERVRSGGRKKVNGKDSFVLRFTPEVAASADSSIDLYFDAKTFRHIRSEYRQKIPDKNAYPTTFIGNQTGENINTLTEDFDDFRVAQGMTLPFKYSVKLLLNSRAATKDFRWTFNFSEYRIGQNFGEDFFTFNKK